MTRVDHIGLHCMPTHLCTRKHQGNWLWMLLVGDCAAHSINYITSAMQGTGLPLSKHIQNVEMQPFFWWKYLAYALWSVCIDTQSVLGYQLGDPQVPSAVCELLSWDSFENAVRPLIMAISPQQSHKGHVAPNVHRRPARPHLDCPVYIFLVFHCCTDPYITFSFSSLFWMTNNVHIDWWWLLTVGCCFSVCGLLSGNKTFPITYVVQQCTTVFQ